MQSLAPAAAAAAVDYYYYYVEYSEVLGGALDFDDFDDSVEVEVEVGTENAAAFLVDGTAAGGFDVAAEIGTHFELFDSVLVANVPFALAAGKKERSQ